MSVTFFIELASVKDCLTVPAYSSGPSPPSDQSPTGAGSVSHKVGMHAVGQAEDICAFPAEVVIRKANSDTPTRVPVTSNSTNCVTARYRQDYGNFVEKGQSNACPMGVRYAQGFAGAV